METQEYFKQKQKVTQAQEALQKTIDGLVSGFEDNYYFKMNKGPTVMMDSLMCNVTLSFFIPCRNENPLVKEAIALIFVANMNFNKQHALQLTEFKGVSVAAKKIELKQDRLLMMMYPEIKLTDLQSYEDSTYAIFKGLVKMQKQSILEDTFSDFCKNMTSSLGETIKEISFHNKRYDIDYSLTPKEHGYVLKRFNQTFNAVMKSIKTGDNFLRLEGFDDAMIALSDIEKKKLHHSLGTCLDIKTTPSFSKKI